MRRLWVITIFYLFCWNKSIDCRSLLEKSDLSQVSLLNQTIHTLNTKIKDITHRIYFMPDLHDTTDGSFPIFGDFQIKDANIEQSPSASQPENIQKQPTEKNSGKEIATSSTSISVQEDIHSDGNDGVDSANDATEQSHNSIMPSKGL